MMTKTNRTRSTISAERLHDLVNRFANTPVLVAGDIILDRYIWGKVDRVSPEAPVVVVQVTKEDQRLGGAANVVRNLAELGASALLCGIVGDDESGRNVVRLLDELGVERSGVITDSSRTTTIKTRVIAHHQQIVRIDHEILHPIEADTAQRLATAMSGSFRASKGIVISDYGKGAVCPALFSEVAAGYRSGILGAGKIPVLVDPKSPHFDLYTKATIIKPNRKEAEEASGKSIPNRNTAVDVARLLLDKWKCEMVLITLGEEGMVLVSSVAGDEPVLEIDTEAREVFDVSGAGDTVSAVFSLALAVGATPREACVLSNIAAGIVVGEVGTVPIRLDRLREALV